MNPTTEESLPSLGVKTGPILPSPSKTLAQMAIDSVIIAGQYQDSTDLPKNNSIDEEAEEESHIEESDASGIDRRSEVHSKEKNHNRGPLRMTHVSNGTERSADHQDVQKEQFKTMAEGRVIIDNSDLPSVANRAKLFGGSAVRAQSPSPARPSALPNSRLRQSASPLPPRASSPNYVNSAPAQVAPRAPSPAIKSSCPVPRSASPVTRVVSPPPRSGLHAARAVSPAPRAASPIARPCTPPQTASPSPVPSKSTPLAGQ
eukprot:2632362-Ditylum_brightwellii.AAC.1